MYLDIDESDVKEIIDEQSMSGKRILDSQMRL